MKKHPGFVSCENCGEQVVAGLGEKAHKSNCSYIKGMQEMAKLLLEKHNEGHTISGDALDLILAYTK